MGTQSLKTVGRNWSYFNFDMCRGGMCVCWDSGIETEKVSWLEVVPSRGPL